MGRKIFTSYKYGDEGVLGNNKDVRDYVTELQNLLDEEEHINKGETDDTDLSELEDDTIRQKLADRMFDSTVTIVIISPNMKEANKSERNQWIPWEISYSLQTRHRKKNVSNPNAVLAVVLPDVNGSYEYYIKENICPDCNARTLKRGILFPILKKNMFNLDPKKIQHSNCLNHNSRVPYSESAHYIESVKWDDFKADPNEYIENALKRQRNLNDYTLVKKLGQ